MKETHPCETHVINGPVTETDPILRVWIIAIRCCVIVPPYDMQDRTGWQERRDLVCIVVNDVPAEIVPCATQGFNRPIRMNRFNTHPLATNVHVGLKRRDLRRFREHVITVAPDIVSTSRNVEGIETISNVARN